jgi:hypothetical protein
MKRKKRKPKMRKCLSRNFFLSTQVQILGKNVALLFMHENAELLPLHRPASVHVHLARRTTYRDKLRKYNVLREKKFEINA